VTKSRGIKGSWIHSNPNPIPIHISENARCIGLGEVMFPPKGDVSATRRAQHVCLDCPVLSDCRDYALRTKQLHGVWGGLSANDRKRMRRTATAKEALVR